MTTPHDNLQMRELIDSAESLVALHYSPRWKDEGKSEIAINRLRAAFAAQGGQKSERDPFVLVYCAIKGCDSPNGLSVCDDFRDWKASLFGKQAVSQDASILSAKIDTSPERVDSVNAEQDERSRYETWKHGYESGFEDAKERLQCSATVAGEAVAWVSYEDGVPAFWTSGYPRPQNAMPLYSTPQPPSSAQAVRDLALDEAVKVVDRLAEKERHVPGRCSLAVAKVADAIRAMKSTTATPPDSGAVRDALQDVRDQALEEACSIVFGQCESDNVAQRTVDAIRRLKSKMKGES